MQNPHLDERLRGIQAILNGVHLASGPLSNSSKGREREAFIDQFLSQVYPTPFRFGSGDITDKTGKRTGQLDVVVEYPFSPSLPIVGTSSTRLYLAEGVAAVIEVKSDVSAQWDEVIASAKRLQPIRREIHSTMSLGAPPGSQIPLFAVGYKGWKDVETVKRKLDPDLVQGILVIDPGVFASTAEYRGIEAGHCWALWGFISSLHWAATRLLSGSSDPLEYAM